MDLRITKRAAKSLSDLDAKQYKQVGSAIMNLLQNPQPHDSRLLQGAQYGDRRVDVGEYRIIYVANDNVLEVLVIGKRNDDEVYKLWKRLSE